MFIGFFANRSDKYATRFKIKSSIINKDADLVYIEHRCETRMPWP